MFCAAIPAAAAVGAKLNVDQSRKLKIIQNAKEKQKVYPIPKMTGMVIGLLAIAAVPYHTLRWRIY